MFRLLVEIDKSFTMMTMRGALKRNLYILRLDLLSQEGPLKEICTENIKIINYVNVKQKHNSAMS